MCLAIPAEVIKLILPQNAVVSVGGVEKEISLALLADKVSVGDYVIIHVGYALNKLDEADAQKTLAYFAELLDVESKI